jgi:hypothetical protein
MHRLTPPRHARITLALVALSALYWLGVWSWVRAELAAMEAAGTNPIALAMHELSLVFPATWGWVIGAAVVHLAALGAAAWKADADARRGALVSAALHVAFAISQGVLAPPA